MTFIEVIRERLSVIALDAADFVKALNSSVAAGIVGGRIYDAMLGHCALKAQAQTIYTWNVKHFSELGPDVARRVRMP